MNDIDIREVSDSPPPITGASTAVTAFLGTAKQGAVNTPTPVHSVLDFTSTFGNDYYADLTHAVRLFFANGGTEAIVVRVPAEDEVRTLYTPDDKSGGIYALEATPTINILNLAGVVDTEVLAKAMDYAETRRAFLVLDPPMVRKKPLDNLVAWTDALPRSANAALFYPRLRVRAPHQKLARITAPGGAIAGLLARTDAMRGVWKTPAGTDATLNEVVSLTVALSDADSATLARHGINPLRAFPQRGIVNWGGRTLRGNEANSDEWKYVSVRRFALFLESSLDAGTQWAVFEPNNERLWHILRASIENFLFDLWQDGAFAGTTPDEAFFVRCDRTTMTQEDIAAGRLIAIVGFAPLRAAEFIQLRWTGIATPDP